MSRGIPLIETKIVEYVFSEQEIVNTHQSSVNHINSHINVSFKIQAFVISNVSLVMIFTTLLLMKNLLLKCTSSFGELIE